MWQKTSSYQQDSVPIQIKDLVFIFIKIEADVFEDDLVPIGCFIFKMIFFIFTAFRLIQSGKEGFQFLVITVVLLLRDELKLFVAADIDRLILKIVTVMERADLCGFPDPDPAEETAEEKPDKPFFVFFKQNDIVFINDPAAVDQFFVDRYDSRSLEIRGILKS